MECARSAVSGWSGPRYGLALTISGVIRLLVLIMVLQSKSSISSSEGVMQTASLSHEAALVLREAVLGLPNGRNWSMREEHSVVELKHGLVSCSQILQFRFANLGTPFFLALMTIVFLCAGHHI